MKKAIIIIVLIVVAKPVFPVLDYILNYNYIATQLCENREKPDLHCNGKCHLAKELAKAAETEKPVSQKKPVQANAEILFLEEIQHFAFPLTARLITASMPEYSNSYSHLSTSIFFHPPVFIL